MENKPSNVKNKAPHPPNDEGKDLIFNALKSFLKKTSSMTNVNVEAIETRIGVFPEEDESIVLVDDENLLDWIERLEILVPAFDRLVVANVFVWCWRWIG